MTTEPIQPSNPADALALDQAQRELAAANAALTQARSELDAARRQINDLSTTATNAQHALDLAERRRAIDEALFEHAPLDLESARLLAEHALAHAKDPDVTSIIADLRRRKPFLFRAKANASAPSIAATPHDTPADRPVGLDEASLEARLNGDRLALLRYLRLKRGV